MAGHYFFINTEAKEIRHHTDQPDPSTLEGFEFCGYSDLPIRSAAASYAKNQSGFSIVDGDSLVPPAAPVDAAEEASEETQTNN